MLLPRVRDRRTIDRYLSAFFRTYRMEYFWRAIAAICRFYGLKKPHVEWYEYLDWGKTAGKTYENGKIHLVHPENWKRGLKYNSERQWIHTVYHEMGHYIFWADAERKAETFAHRIVRGINRQRRPATIARRACVR
jgi:predicted SprT family Zn-dependent metalloprotease